MSVHLLDLEIAPLTVLLKLYPVGKEEGGTAIGLGDKTVPLGQLHDLLPVLVRQTAEQISGW